MQLAVLDAVEDATQLVHGKKKWIKFLTVVSIILSPFYKMTLMQKLLIDNQKIPKFQFFN